MGPLGESLAAWILLPALLYLIALGWGLLACRLARFEAPNALVAPLGLAVALVAGLPLYRLDLGAWPAVIVLAVGALIGLGLARGELRERVNPGPAGLAALAAFGLYLAPVVLAGGWTWTGYNFVNDTALQFQLTDHLAEHGFARPMPPGGLESSTSDRAVSAYLDTFYPLGAHALLASAGNVIPAPTPALYQPFMAVLVSLAAMALASLAARATGSQALAALAAAVAVASNLLYVYVLQGNLKELAALTMLAVAAAVGRELLAEVRSGPAALFGICLAAMLAVYSSAAVPYVGGLVVAVLGAALVRSRGAVRARLLKPVLAGIGALAVASVVTASDLLNSFRLLSDTFGAGKASKGTGFEAAGGVASELGQLLRTLPFEQMAGVWLGADYRVPVGPDARALNTIGIVAVFALALLGVFFMWRRREAGPLLLLGPCIATVLVVGPRVSPYAEAKLLAIASPALVMVAVLGALALKRFSRAAAWLAGALVTAALLASNAIAYHSVRLAPIDRMLAMQDVGERYQNRGVLLVTEQDEFVKYFMRDALNVSMFDSISLKQVALRVPQFYIGRSFDLDEMRLDFLESSPWLVQRQAPDSSRPPANFSLDYENAYYRVWRRGARPKVARHLPLQRGHSPTAVPSCRAALRLAGRATAGDRLVAATGKPLVLLDPTLDRHRTPGWPRHPVLPGTVTPLTPGHASVRATVPPGRYRAWIQGSFGRPVTAGVGGRPLGEAKGVNSVGEWHLVASLATRGGRKQLELRRGGGGLAPGDGFGGDLGPLVLEPSGRSTLHSVRRADARSLCRRHWDWIELVRD